jgi:predicted Zn-dependent protease
MIYGENPREGFFEGRRFYHPEMAFQLDFPDGWEASNSKQAVQAGSPEGDAMMALTLAEGATPAATLTAFLSQEGMEAVQPSSAAVHGIPAATADFRLTTPDGVLRGSVSFIDYRGTIMRFLGVAPEEGWPNRRGVVRNSLESFRVLSDRSILDVQPARLRVTTVPRAMELISFLNREGAADRADHVRRLNRLQGNPTLPAGRVLKVPVGGVLPGGG